MRMILIRKCNQERVLKCCSRFIKANFVFASVATSFFLVPIEYQFHRVIMFVSAMRFYDPSKSVLESLSFRPLQEIDGRLPGDSPTPLLPSWRTKETSN